MSTTKFGLTLSNRSVVLGMSDVPAMLDLARAADAASVWDSVWIGDSIFAKPRLDAMVALGGLAAVTERVKLGVGCMASTPLRDALLLAYQWASFDFMCNGRSIFVACQGQREAGGGKFAEEFAAFGIDPASRSGRMEEANRDHATHLHRGARVLRRPVQPLRGRHGVAAPGATTPADLGYRQSECGVPETPRIYAAPCRAFRRRLDDDG